jgi:hypothetical protein
VPRPTSVVGNRSVYHDQPVPDNVAARRMPNGFAVDDCTGRQLSLFYAFPRWCGRPRACRSRSPHRFATAERLALARLVSPGSICCC